MTDGRSSKYAEAYIEAYNRLGTYAAVAKEIGVNASSVRKFFNRRKLDPAIQESMDAVGTDLVPALVWAKTKNPDGTSYSTLLKPAQEDGESLLDRLARAFENIPAATPTPAPLYADDDLLTLYPIADAHIGMMAWGDETGEDYDTRIACDRLRSWVGQCIASAPPSSTAVVLIAGDFLHANDDTSQTPKSRHILDTDTRFFRTLDMAIEALAACVDLASEKHARVIVRVLPGNHDKDSYRAVLFAMAQRYRSSDRITVDKTPTEFWVHEHGKVMLASHHGDKAKPDRLAMDLICQHRETFGRSRFCYLFTGHLHSDHSRDIGGVFWQQLRAMTARDAYAASNSWTSHAELQAITYHKERGEISRVRVCV